MSKRRAAALLFAHVREHVAAWLVGHVVLRAWRADCEVYGNVRGKSAREYRWEKRTWRWVAGWDLSRWP